MMPDYDLLDAALARADVGAGAAEAHGSLCGLMSVHATADSATWIDSLLEGLDVNDVLVQEARGLLQEVYEHSRQEMLDSNLGFYPLLPSDERSLEERVEALGLWCQGYLFGLALGGVTEETEFPEDSAEILNDIAQIATVGFDAEEDEENETAYAEIIEFLRTGVLLVSEELQPLKAPPQIH